jgi:hypothetical protein
VYSETQILTVSEILVSCSGCLTEGRPGEAIQVEQKH